MYQIAVCDDKEVELDKVENMLASYQKQYTGCSFATRRFADADQLLRAVREGPYMPDLLFMDIYMPGKLGVEAAKELRGMGSGCQIVFLTVSKEYALEAFQVEAVQYLVKPISEKELFPVLDRVRKKAEEERKKCLLLRVGNKICRVALRDIVYCEAQKKCQCMHLADGTQLQLRLTMAKLNEMLAGYQEFSKAGVSYIVNLEHIKSLSTREMQLDNGNKIYLPRGSFQVLREKYFDYYCNEDASNAGGGRMDTGTYPTEAEG